MRVEVSTRHGIDAEIGVRPDVLARTRTFHMLDLLRGLGAGFIVAFHAGYIYGLGSPTEAHFLVDLFFVMSGFVIPFRYESDLRTGMALATFAKIRFVRLYPLFLLGSLLGAVPAVVALAFGHADGFHRGLVGSLPLAIAMLPSSLAAPRLDTFYPLNYVAWSLSLELVVNVAYAATFRVWTTKAALVVTGALFVALAFCAAHYGSLDGGPTWADAPVGPVRAAFGFGVGLLLYRLYQRRAFTLPMPWWALPPVVLFFALSDAPVNVAAWDVFQVAVLVPLIIYAAIAVEPPRRLQGVCAMGGLYSYVLYSLHVPMIGLFLYGAQELQAGAYRPGVVGALAFTALVVGGTIAAHVLYDKPIRRFLSKRWVWRHAPRDRAERPVPSLG